MKVQKSIKAILYIMHHISMWKEVTFKTDHAYFSKLYLRVIFLKKQHFRTFNKTFFLKTKVKFKSGCAQFSKLWVLKWVILVKKQRFVGWAVYIHKLLTLIFFCHDLKYTRNCALFFFASMSLLLCFIFFFLVLCKFEWYLIFWILRDFIAYLILTA